MGGGGQPLGSITGCYIQGKLKAPTNIILVQNKLLPRLIFLENFFCVSVYPCWRERLGSSSLEQSQGQTEQSQGQTS